MSSSRDAVLITGGAGFIGTNLASRLLRDGRRVVVLDSLARAGVERNVRWLQEQYGAGLSVVQGDVRDARLVRELVAGVSDVFHLAAQVAVTTSLVSPVDDFEVNARGTLNVLEAVRSASGSVRLLFTSTNKVYGALEDVALTKGDARVAPADPRIRDRGIGEWRALCFESPYGCSKGAADQYVLDYCRSYGIAAAVFRMSCIYGPHQMGTEDQGWLAHFLIRAQAGDEIIIYGDGLQVRDALYVDDLVDAMTLAMSEMEEIGGRAYNIGGGPDNTTSLVELLSAIRVRFGLAPDVQHAETRIGDQRYFVADTSRFEAAVGWKPRVSLDDGLSRLHEWVTTGYSAGSNARSQAIA